MISEFGAGAGPTPFYTGGRIYLAGPYKGAPLSFVAIVPATAGPFDLGVVVNRIAASATDRFQLSGCGALRFDRRSP